MTRHAYARSQRQLPQSLPSTKSEEWVTGRCVYLSPRGEPNSEYFSYATGKGMCQSTRNNRQMIIQRPHRDITKLAIHELTKCDLYPSVSSK
ncbi:MAG: hypothetical protein JWN00_547 [Actinomycetia bacterium]|nr:hypothetical protein [Actinomycetes bacterium]